MAEKKRNFIRDIIDADLESGKHTSVTTRFPPEPNGYLHIGHAKAICLNFSLAADYSGHCHLRMDDTNPSTEEVEYVESIQHDIQWLGFDWGEHLYYASDYFQKMYEHAVRLIQKGQAYVDDADEETIRASRGTVSEPGRPTPGRSRSPEENLALFEKMRAGEFEDGSRVLRAKIDLANPNMLMRDPILYRIRHAHHYRQGDEWCIYPLYDFAHCLEDAFEGITHSICTLEFENNRELYDWVLIETEAENRPQQIEMARLALTYTVMSKRKLLELVKNGHVNGWDDPRMPTIAGFRRRGYTPESIRRFCDLIGVAKANSLVDMAQLEFTIRDDLNQKAPRVLAVLDPLKVVIENYKEGETEWLDAPFYPHDVPLEGSRQVPFSRTLYIDRDDFEEVPPNGFHRLSPGKEVRLRYAYFIKCEQVIKDDAGNVVELRCSYDPQTKGGKAPDGRKVKGTIHWVSAEHAAEVEVRVYDRLFTKEIPGVGDRVEIENLDADLLEEQEGGVHYLDHLNPDSLRVLAHARVEPSVAEAETGTRFQFERRGYFIVDPDSKSGRLVFNRIVPLRDSWAKQETVVAKTRPKATGPAGPKEIPARSAALEARWQRYEKELGLDADAAEFLSRTEESADFFEATLALHADAALVAKWIVNESLARELSAPHLAELLALLADGTISGRIAKDVLEAAAESGTSPRGIVADRGLEQIADSASLEPIVEKVLAENADKVKAYKDGQTKLLGFFVGQVMKATAGKANPQMVDQLVRARLD